MTNPTPLADLVDKAVEHLSNMYAQLRPETDPSELRSFVMFERREDRGLRAFVYPQRDLCGMKGEIVGLLAAGYDLAVLCVMADDEYLWKAGPGYEESDANQLIDSAINDALLQAKARFATSGS